MSELTPLHDELVGSFYFPRDHANCIGAAKGTHPSAKGEAVLTLTEEYLVIHYNGSRYEHNYGHVETKLQDLVHLANINDIVVNQTTTGLKTITLKSRLYKTWHGPITMAPTPDPDPFIEALIAAHAKQRAERAQEKVADLERQLQEARTELK